MRHLPLVFRPRYFARPIRNKWTLGTVDLLACGRWRHGLQLPVSQPREFCSYLFHLREALMTSKLNRSTVSVALAAAAAGLITCTANPRNEAAGPTPAPAAGG